ncbi:MULTISPECIES: RIP metalloprotease RseP [Ensifer]|jgi:regulator of sigma E protease|uniref:RIP metalloprotease RseP n=1 Tax=Ensifer TaxID=106591 RepID=UPI00042EB5F0|nr:MULTISPECIES: RIP metalloprotease RseP [Ensifer]AHK44241.1 zinc metallopeptidase [Ensifer adhaerens OV14]MDP9629954.1 regulator of sigma E protease [Ensifer adhaerens]KQU96894.1 RIP metalloprotease RseP [Ensifer sp. Root31]KQW60880.1 RIP metalloprotease RseP [Ensifer sp. Root1252]KQW75423.1 RIP metalloprotease RseP [Ensifer sp. Root127]
MTYLLVGLQFVTGYIVPFLLVLTLLVFVHEMGHYLVGRWSGIRILAFSVGFGPELLGWTDKHGTRWKFCAIPLGGYVKFYGDEDAASTPDYKRLEAISPEERSRTFLGAKLWKRAATVAAGPIANFILAIAIFAVLFAVYGRSVADPVVAQVKENSAAAKAGILPRDRLIAIDGTPVATFDDVRRYVSVRPELEIKIRIQRDGSFLDLPMVPERTEISDQFGNKMEVGIIGIVTDQDAGNFRLVTYGPIEAIGQGALQSWHIVTGTFDYLANLVTGRMKADQLGGPIRVAQASGQMATLGVAAVLQLAAVLSVSIGLLNLMPVPVLDGGHLMFYAVEALRGKPVGAAAQDVAYRIGFAMVLMLMVFATWNDISMFFG